MVLTQGRRGLCHGGVWAFFLALKGRQFTAGGERSVTPGKWVIIKIPLPWEGQGEGICDSTIIYQLPQRIAGRAELARYRLASA